MNTAENNAKRHHRQPHAHPEGIDAEGIFPRGTNRVALYGIECKSESNGNKHGKEDSHPAFTQTLLHVIGRSANKRFLTANFIELRQCRFHKGTRRTEQGNEPHPKHGTRSADGNGSRHTGQVARTDTAGNRHRKRLKRRNMLLAVLRFWLAVAQQTHHLLHHPKLHKPSPERKPQGTADKHYRQHIRPQHIVDRGYYTVNPFHSFSS